MSALTKHINNKVFKRFPPGIWLMMVVDMFVTIGFSIAMPFLALYLYNERGLSMSVVGTVFLVSGLCTAGTNMLGGMLSDRIGRRRLFISITIFSIFAYAALSVLIGTSSPVWLIALVYVIARSVFGTINPTVMAVVADLSPNDRLTETYAFVRVGGNIGFALGPALGGYLINTLTYGWLLSISAFSCLVVALLIIFFLHEAYGGGGERVDMKSTLAVAKDRLFLVFIAFSLLLVLSVAHLGSTLSVFTVDRIHLSTEQYGLLLTTNGIMVAITQYPVTYVVSKFSKQIGLIAGSLFYTIGYFSLGFVEQFNWAVMSLIIITAGEVVFSPISSSVVAESAPPDKRGRYMGFFALTQTIGYSLAPLFGGVLLDSFPTNNIAIWGIIASIGLIAALGFWRWGQMKQLNTPVQEVFDK
jgi:predicted MFS family arabinose efflux permease